VRLTPRREQPLQRGFAATLCLFGAVFFIVAFDHRRRPVAKAKLPTTEQVKAFLEEVKSQTDRGAAIVASAVVENLIEVVILERLIELPGERKDALFYRMGAPLSSFSAKVEMAFALGIIANELRLTLHLIRDLRNKFAHRVEALTFDHQDIDSIIKSRASPSVRESSEPNREKFMKIFYACTIILIGTWGADMRLKSLEETHADHFLRWFATAVETAQEAVREVGGAKPPSGQHRPRPG
jgi:hypothetical protein